MRVHPLENYPIYINIHVGCGTSNEWKKLYFFSQFTKSSYSCKIGPYVFTILSYLPKLLVIFVYDSFRNRSIHRSRYIYIPDDVDWIIKVTVILARFYVCYIPYLMIYIFSYLHIFNYEVFWFLKPYIIPK